MRANVVISPQATIVDALHLLNNTAHKILFVCTEQNILIGSVTDGDIRRYILNNGDLSGPISEAMQRKPYTVTDSEKQSAYKLMNRLQIDALPLIDINNRLIDVIFYREQQYGPVNVSNKLLSEVPVVIMAGGEGTRLNPYTKVLPKPLIPIGEKPIVERIIEMFSRYGAKKYLISVNHKRNMIKAYFSEGEYSNEITYIDEPLPLGTAGSLSLAKRLLNSTFVLSNCDTMVLTDYCDVLEKHRKEKNIITILTAQKRIVIPYGVISSREDGSVDFMTEKPEYNYAINTGVYIIEPELLNYIPCNSFIHLPDVIQTALEHNNRVGTFFVDEGDYLDMGQMEEMERMKRKLGIE